MKKALAASLLAASMLLPSYADAALNAYLRISGAKSGPIKGSVTQKGREEKIMVIAVEHEMKNDGAGKRHGVFTITKELDKSSPLLNQMLATAEPIKDFELQFWTPQVRAATGAGVETQHYTVKLTNARISSIKFHMLNNKNPDLMKYAEYEEVSFTYDRIDWTWVEGGITAADNAKF